jgi:GLPGLI family protein
MKKILIFIFCLWNTNVVLYSQNYLAEYNSNANEAGGTLLFNTTSWRFNVIAKMELEFSSDDVSIQDLDLQDDLSKKGNATITQFNFRSLDKNYYLDEEIIIDFKFQNKFVIKDELRKPKWTIVSDSMKMIDSYTCLLAKGFLCGRNFTAWFTPDIPVSAGPWKLWGLPGLIVSARSNDGVVNYHLSSLKKTDQQPIEPIVEKTISPEEFKTQWNDAIKKISRTIRSFSDGIDIEVTSLKVQMADKSLLE